MTAEADRPLADIVAGWLADTKPKPSKPKPKPGKGKKPRPYAADPADELLAETERRSGEALRAFREEIARARRDETAVVMLEIHHTCTTCGSTFHAPNPQLFLELPLKEGRWLLAVDACRARNAAASVPRRVEHIERLTSYCHMCFEEACYSEVLG